MKRGAYVVSSIAVSLLAGGLFQLVHMPLPWMLGPMAAMMTLAGKSGRTLWWPAALRDMGMVPLGYMMGLSFTPETGRQILSQLPSLLVVTMSGILFSVAVGYVIHRRVGLDLTSCLLGSVPGGLTQMVILGEEMDNTDSTAIALMQTVRLLAAISIVPFLTIHGLGGSAVQAGVPAGNTAAAAFWPMAAHLALAGLGGVAACRLHLPIAFLLGPIFSIAALRLYGLDVRALPPALLIASQVCVGMYMGKGMSLKGMRGRMMLYAVLGGVSTVAFSLAVAGGMAIFHPMELTSAVLASAPGGMAEMGLTAVLLNADVPTVVAYQLFRMTFIVLVFPLFIRYGLSALTARFSKNGC